MINFKNKKTIGITIGVALVVLLGIFIFYPAGGNFVLTDFNPQEPPEYVGPLAINNDLQTGKSLGEGKLNGPEDTAIGLDGYIYTGTSDGYVNRVSEDGQVEKYAYVGGYPVGMDFDAEGNLYVCEPHKGLIRITKDREVQLITTEAGGVKINFADDVKVAPDGMVYFSDASTKYSIETFVAEMLEAAPNGRVIRYNPNTDEINVVLSGVHDANGIAIPESNEYLLVNETSRYQVRKLWLNGEKAGQDEVLINNLPGSPDGLAVDSDGNYMITFFMRRNEGLDFMHRHPILKNIMAKVPQIMEGNNEPIGFIGVFSPEGEFIRSYHDPTGEVAHTLTSVEEKDGKMILGSLHANKLVVVER